MFGAVWFVTALWSIDFRLVGGNAIFRNSDVVRPSTAAANQTTVITWDERPDSLTTKDDGGEDDKLRLYGRGLFQGFRRFFKPSPTTDGTATSDDWPPLPPHPLRTNLWEIQCRWRGQAYRSRRRHRIESHSVSRRETKNRPQKRASVDRFSSLILDFDSSGYVRVRPASDDTNHAHSNQNFTWQTVGTWTLEPAGVKCRIPILGCGDEVGSTTTNSIHTATLDASDRLGDTCQNTAVDEKESVLTMDFHANPFGAQPKFTRGILYGKLHQSSWPWRLRPVLATFTGRGIGIDTVDLSYRQRQLPPTADP